MLTKAQKSLIDNLKQVEQFNNFDPKTVIDALTKHADLWKDGIYDPDQDDTLYLYPKAGKKDKLELMAYKEMVADEIDYCDLVDYNLPTGVKWSMEYKYPVIATGGLRIWWD